MRRGGNTFGFTAFTSYGAFWEFYALLQILADLKVLTVLPPSVAVGWSLILWGILTLYLWGGAMLLNLALNLVFLTLWLAFVTLGAGAVYSSTALTHVGGYFGILAATFAAYTSFAIVMNSISLACCRWGGRA